VNIAAVNCFHDNISNEMRHYKGYSIPISPVFLDSFCPDPWCTNGVKSSDTASSPSLLKPGCHSLHMLGPFLFYIDTWKPFNLPTGRVAVAGLAL
jgi:hypothetical protein